MRSIDLRKDTGFVNQYIELRNTHANTLLTLPVDMESTLEWLRRTDIDVIGLIEGNTLLGAVIIYYNRKGEITFIAKEPGKGIGGKLLVLIEELALKKRLDYIWAWTLIDNFAAQRAFEKNGFRNCGVVTKHFCGQRKDAIKFIKPLNDLDSQYCCPITL